MNNVYWILKRQVLSYKALKVVTFQMTKTKLIMNLTTESLHNESIEI